MDILNEYTLEYEKLLEQTMDALARSARNSTRDIHPGPEPLLYLALVAQRRVS